MPADGGIRFGQYVLLRRIARGGMAEVFLAQQRGLEGFDRRVAVKRILPHLADSPEFVKMFLGEAKLAAQLAHPNVVHIYDFGKVDNDYFIAMEFVDGVHAGQIFKLAESPREKMSPTLVARIGADAATALHYAHELVANTGQPLGLVHRDVSPANLMVSYDGVVKLCDFGIAKAAALSDSLTNPGQVKGKYAYMSPEQTIAAPLDGRSDVFSLSIVLWELLAGKTIVGRGDAVDAMRAIRDGKLPSLEKAAPTTPEPLLQAIAWGLETKRDRRCTAAELATALEAFIKASPEIAGPMQLAQWVRTRFPRAETGPLAIIPDGPIGTNAAPGTAVSPGTVAAPGTQASRLLPVTPPTRVVAASVVIETPDPDDDTSETMIAPDKNIAAGPPSSAVGLEGATLIDDRRSATRLGDVTLIDDPSHRAALETTERDPPMVTAEDTLGGETIMRTGSKRPFVPNANAVPTQHQPRLEPRRQAPVVTDATQGVRRSPPRRRLFAAVGMFALAMISFSIVLCVRSPRGASSGAGSGSGTDARRGAAPLDAAPLDARPAVIDHDARTPTIAADATVADTTTILKVNTRPPGGRVKVGDQARTAPAEFALPAGKHTVMIELDGWQPEQREVDLPYGVDTVLEMAFSRRVTQRPPPEKQMGRLTVRTIPWSDVYFGARKIGQAPFADLPMPVGSYTLLFKHPNHETVRRTVTIHPNKTTKLGFNLP